jgi:hypothetical protein
MVGRILIWYVSFTSAFTFEFGSHYLNIYFTMLSIYMLHLSGKVDTPRILVRRKWFYLVCELFFHHEFENK